MVGRRRMVCSASARSRASRPSARLAIFVVALLVPVASPWVLFPAASNQDLIGKYSSIRQLANMTAAGTPTIFRWPEVTSVRSTKGIGGGITYAYDPKFCDDIIGKFSERESTWLRFWEFVTCDSIKKALLLAFDTWSANHPNIHFIDITEHCIAEGLNKPVVPSVCSSTNCVRCSAAEIMISTFTKQDEADHSGARVMPIELSSAKALGTNGITEEGGTFKYVELHYANDICWYLDQTFCSFFFNAEIAGVDVEKLMVSLFVIIEFSSCMILITFLLLLARSFFNTLLITWDTDKDGSVEASEIIGAGRAACVALFTLLSTCSTRKAKEKMGGRTLTAGDANLAVVYTLSKLNILVTSLVLTFIAFPPVFYFSVFRPCWNCQDFTAASVHEIGHILGLDHPDEHASQNFASERDEYNCSEPFKGVSMTSNYDANSVLRAQLVHDPKTCLTNDDLDGLNFLYPVCENRIQTPQCISNTLNLGWLRLALACLAAVFIPIIIVLVLKIYAKLMLRCSTRMRDKRFNLKEREVAKQKELNAKANLKRMESKERSHKGGAGATGGSWTRSAFGGRKHAVQPADADTVSEPIKQLPDVEYAAGADDAVTPLPSTQLAEIATDVVNSEMKAAAAVSTTSRAESSS